MATLLDKIEQELVGLMGETGRTALKNCLERIKPGENDIEFFDKVALVQELSKTFSMIMPQDAVLRLKLKLLNLKGDEEK